MNILNCSQNYYIRGGSDKYFFDLAKLLEGYGDTVVPFCASSINNLHTAYSKYFPSGADLDNPGVLDVFKYIYNRDASRQIIHLLRDNRIDLAHLHIYYGKLTSSILPVLKSCDVPIVQTLHEYKLVCPVYTMHDKKGVCHSCSDNKFYMSLIKKCNRNSYARSAVSMVESYCSILAGSQKLVDCFITVSDFQKNEILKMGFDEDKIQTVHNFIEYKNYRVELSNQGYFLYFGRVEKIKGVEVLLKAFEILKNIKLIILGDGEYLIYAKNYCKENNMNNVEFVNHVEPERVAKYVQGAIATISPSTWYETFGLTLLESLSCGKPVIASDIGGMTEILTEGSDGFFVEPGDVNQLVERIKYLSDNPAIVQEMGLNGRRKVEEKFSPDAHMSKIKGIYGSLI